MRNGLKAAGISAALIFCTHVSVAQETTAAEPSVAEEGAILGACMVEHRTKEHDTQFKTMLIDALNDDTEALNKSALAMGMGAIMLATQHCGLAMTDLQSPKFEKAAEIYGEAVVTKIFESAMSKVGIN